MSRRIVRYVDGKAEWRDDGPAYARVHAGGPRGSALRDAIPPVLTAPAEFRWKDSKSKAEEK